LKRAAEPDPVRLVLASFSPGFAGIDWLLAALLIDVIYLANCHQIVGDKHFARTILGGETNTAASLSIFHFAMILVVTGCFLDIVRKELARKALFIYRLILGPTPRESIASTTLRVGRMALEFLAFAILLVSIILLFGVKAQ
jgi:hypothetical protein